MIHVLITKVINNPSSSIELLHGVQYVGNIILFTCNKVMECNPKVRYVKDNSDTYNPHMIFISIIQNDIE